MESKLRPKVVLWWGIGLALAGVLLTLLLPQLSYSLMPDPSSATGVDQGFLVLLSLVIRIVGDLLTPLGVALIGASVVMAYVGRLLAAREPETETALDEQ
ncbi:hypothetical protein [Leifsonia virtsii]|uniref:Uncharacterized protein n=1 Tax=Leifsonia virtsii TaxID=3035915 RepID=A0ABT8J0L7_9MICO|nr:hypothetical protein [Leifsonia virtsii]MDN4598605.1 hypothetical protein [Leifsonia virtsii]